MKVICDHAEGCTRMVPFVCGHITPHEFSEELDCGPGAVCCASREMLPVQCILVVEAKGEKA